MGCAKTAEPIENAVWGVDPGGPEEPCIRWTPDLTRGRGNFGGAPPAMRLFRQSSLATCLSRWHALL